MDWTKAKNIIIVALVVTNLVLIGSLFIEYVNTQKIEKLVLADTILMLQSRKISIETELPGKIGSMPTLYIEYDNADEAIIEENLKNQEGILGIEIDEKGVENYVNNFLVSCNIMTENVVIYKIANEKGIYNVEYKNIVNKIPLEDSYIKCIFKDGKIQEFKRIWLKPLELGKTKRQVMSISSALVRFMNKIGESADKDNEIKVEKIEFVYWLDTTALDLNSPVSDTAFPAWKFTFNKGKVIHILAYKI
jgi:regulatory protein YycI of two-component signal transduction system YycFG